MRTTVIPAQITTVEDKIAGNLNFTQIMILMIPIFWTTILFAFVPPVMKLVVYKLPLIVVVFIVCLVLSLRIKGRVVLTWILILLRFNLRPSYFVFNKNDDYLRGVDQMENANNTKARLSSISNKNILKKLQMSEVDSVKLAHVLSNQDSSLRIKLNNKGGLNVAFEQIKK